MDSDLFGYFPLSNNYFLWMLGLGFLFGFFLEVGGLGSPRKIVAQFSFKDWTVFKLMFISIVVAAIGIALLTELQWLMLDSLKIPTPHYLAMLVGGALLGAGLAVGGYCPGTSVVGFVSGRLDGLFFILGMLVGIFIFAFSFSWIKPLFLTTQGTSREMLPELLGLPAWVIIVFLAILAAVGFWLGSGFEKRSGGPLSASNVTYGDSE